MDDSQSPMCFVGHHDPRRPLPVTSDAIQDAHAANYDMLTTPITTHHFHSRVLALLSSSMSDSPAFFNTDMSLTRNASPVTVSPLTPADSPLTPEDTTGQLIAVTSAWIDLSSADPIIADISRQVLKLELSYAAFCGITYVAIPSPRMRNRDGNDGGLAQYARAILDGLSQGPYMQLFIWLPMIDHSEDDREDMGDLASFARPQYQPTEEEGRRRLDLFGTWEVWNVIRSVCKYSSRLFIALSLPKLMPPSPIQSRWYSEPVRVLTLDADIFAKNSKGYPVLTKAHQALIARFVRLRNPPWLLLCNVGAIPSSKDLDQNGITVNGNAFPTLAESTVMPSIKDPTPHLSYLRNLETRQPAFNSLDSFGRGYQDFLQAPLQPLTVNLESITYEVFEKDPVKYAWYERAIATALSNWHAQHKPSSNPDGRIVVAVVGAGRGPLVTRALNASESTGVPIDLWALEKNPNAFVLLQRHNASIWGGRVNLVKSDMRTWRGPLKQANATEMNRLSTAHETNPLSPSATFTGSPDTDSTYLLATATHQASHYKIDILISELLGSFADNELSPECLDGVQHLLNPVHGISIPQDYTAFISPIAAPKLHADISNSMTPNNPSAAETPYVVMLNAIDHISTTEGQELSHNPTSSLNDTSLSPIKPQPQSPLSSHPPVQTSYSRAHTTTSTHQRTTSSLPSIPKPIILPTWSFSHPNPLIPSSLSSNAHNTRFSHLTFPISHRATCHGLAGYFESVLYPSSSSPNNNTNTNNNQTPSPDPNANANPNTNNSGAHKYSGNSDSVQLSTNPLTMDAKSADMISWFPIYFPLKTPIFIPDNSELDVSMWRCCDERKVWYEWKVDVYAYLHRGADGRGGGAGREKNKSKNRGRRVRVGGSELHSSEKEACMM